MSHEEKESLLQVCIVVIWFMYQIHINQLRFTFQRANFERKLGFHVVFSQVDSVMELA